MQISDSAYPPESEDIQIIHSLEATEIVHFCFQATVQAKTIYRLIDELPLHKSLNFYDEKFPSPSDPGAYFRVERSENCYFITCGNHGWSMPWLQVDTDTLCRYLWGCREFHWENCPDKIFITKSAGIINHESDNTKSIFRKVLMKRLHEMEYSK